MKQRVRAAVTVVAGLALLGGAGVGLLAPARADEGSQFGGFTSHTSAAATRFVFDLRDNPIPSEHTFDMSIPFSRADLDAGPQGHALASAAWPGDTVANACTAAPEIPCWPYRAEAFSPNGPFDARDEQVPGMTTTAHSNNFDVGASSRGAGAGANPYFNFGNVSATSNSTIKNGKVVGESVSSVGQTVLGPAREISIDSIVTTVQVTSDAKAAVATAKTVIQGASVGGVPVTIDQGGVHVQGQGTDTTLGKVLDQTVRAGLKSAGIEMFVAQPIKTINGTSGDVVAGGVIISIDGAPTMGRIFPIDPQFPDPTNKMTLVLAQAAATVDASGGFGDFTPLEDLVTAPTDTGTDIPTDVAGFGAEATTETFDSSGTALPTETASGPASSGGRRATLPTASLAGAVGGKPISLMMFLTALFGAILAGVGLRRLATDGFAPAPTTTCPLETR